MLAFLGWVVTVYHAPVLGVSPLEAHQAGVASGANAQVLTLIAALEFIGVVALKQTFDGKRAPGDFSFDPLNLYGKLDSKGKEVMQLKELENGRLAMVGFSGLGKSLSLLLTRVCVCLLHSPLTPALPLLFSNGRRRFPRPGIPLLLERRVLGMKN